MSDPNLVALCRAQHPRLVGLLMLHVGDRWVAEELAQDALLRMCERWPQVREMDNPEGWLSTVATNLARSTLRRRSAERRARVRHGVTDEVHREPDAGVAAAIRDAVADLPERQRTAVAYRYYVGLPVAQTAHAMGIAEGTVRALTHQALTRLRDAGWAIDNEEAAHAQA